MASKQDFVDHILGQFDPDLGVSARKMFGEYGLYSQGKMFGLVCDNRLFIKPLPVTGELSAGLPLDSPYYKARPHILVEEPEEDRELLNRLAKLTVENLPEPKPKVKK